MGTLDVAGRAGSMRLVTVVVGLLLLLSACKVEMEVATTVEEDGSGELAVQLMLGETARSTLQESEPATDDLEERRRIIAEEGPEALEVKGPDPVDVLAETVPDGWRHERVVDGKIEGLRLTTRFGAVDEIPDRLERLNDWGDEFATQYESDAAEIGLGVVTNGFAIERDDPLFHLRGEPDARPYEGATGGPNNLLAEFTISVKLPGGVRDHNADEETDGALVWHIAPGTAREISATSDLTYDPFEIPWTPIAVGGATAGMVGLLALRSLRERRRAASGRDEPPGPTGMHDDVPVPV